MSNFTWSVPSTTHFIWLSSFHFQQYDRICRSDYLAGVAKAPVIEGILFGDQSLQTSSNSQCLIRPWSAKYIEKRRFILPCSLSNHETKVQNGAKLTRGMLDVNVTFQNGAKRNSRYAGAMETFHYGADLKPTHNLFPGKTLNNNEQNLFFQIWACTNEHRQQTIVLTKTTGQQPGSGHCYLRSSLFWISSSWNMHRPVTNTQNTQRLN